MSDSQTFQLRLNQYSRCLPVGNSGHSVVLTVSVLLSVKGKWKRVELDAGVGLNVIPLAAATCF